MNKIMLIGNLGRDPEMSYTSTGKAVTRFSLAVNRRFKGADGTTEETEWFNIVAWERLAETCNNYLHKGTKVFIEGRVQQRKYTDKEGIQRTSVDVVATDMEMLTPKSQSQGTDDFMNADADLDDQPF
ncbi:MAG: single-stranded DNA-binding protein [Ktedonobacteraceae bacterium]|nr:single-stranded DNA-binding protein [Ktedonobacteraceae bacterium]MBO0792584.1 single-stranded DNA-binding protein [Ktedonobacteraceae bacterium]